MILSAFFPLVILIVSSFAPDDGDVAGVRTHAPTEQDISEFHESASDVDTEQSHVSDTVVESTQESSAVAVVEGDSSVSITIDTASSPQENNTGVSDLSAYKYPGASVAESSADSLHMHTNDNAESVTSWYEHEIQSRGMNTQSFVRTNSNGNILNKLGASGNGESILVEISTENGSDATYIRVTRG